MNREKKIQICRGCESLFPDDPKQQHNLNCRMEPMYEDKQCPCLTCLVKMRCRVEKGCEEFAKYRRNLPLRYL